MDTLGLLSRDIDSLRDFFASSLPALKQNAVQVGDKLFFPDCFAPGWLEANEVQLPKRILYCTDFLPHSNPDQQALIDDFVRLLEAHLGVERTSISLAERWSQCPPPESEGKDLKTYIEKVLGSLTYISRV